MMSNQHVLKIHPAPLADLLSGAKTAEVRRNDRGFQVGDTVRLMEVNPETGNWTGAADHVRTISHIQTGYGLPDGMCVLSYARAEHQEAQGAQAGDEILSSLRRRGLSIDGDNSYKQDLIDAIIGAMMFGAQGSSPPPAGHWLEQFYVIGREEREASAALATQPAVRECSCPKIGERFSAEKHAGPCPIHDFVRGAEHDQ